MSRTLSLSGAYLTEILSQYHSGKQDDLPYRIARRDAHNADAELSNTLTSMLKEPGRYRLSPDTAYRFLCASHTLLGYVSALGAHREQITLWHDEDIIRTMETKIHQRLGSIADALANQRNVNESPDGSVYLPSEHSLEGAQARVMRQLVLIDALMPELTELANDFAAANAGKHSVASVAAA